jgi:hypothetical protein
LFAGDGPVAIYPALMVKMGTDNRCSLEVSFLHLSNAQPILAVWVADEPNLILEIFDEEATNVTFQLYPEYQNIETTVHVRLTELPIVDKIRDLRSDARCEQIGCARRHALRFVTVGPCVHVLLVLRLPFCLFLLSSPDNIIWIVLFVSRVW